MNDRVKTILGLAIISILVLTIITFVWIFFVRNAVVDYNSPPQVFFPDQDDQNKGRACTEEAKLCPDGSAVGRTGPNCEFAPCPGDDLSGWQTYRNEKYGFELTLEDAWKGYYVEEEKGGSDSIYLRFWVPTTEKIYGSGKGFADPMVISVFTRDQWSKQQLEEGPKPGYLGENSRYIFGYSNWQDCPSDLCGKIKFQNIIPTFKAF